MNADTGEPPSTESTTSSPVDMAVGDEDAHHKLRDASDTATVDPFPDHLSNRSGLVTMETVLPGGEGGEVVGGMSQHNGLPGYSPPRERQDSEATLGTGEVGLVADEEDDEGDEGYEREGEEEEEEET